MTPFVTGIKLRLGLVFEQRWLNVGLRTKMAILVILGLAGLLTTFSLLGISAARQAAQQLMNERVLLARMSAATLDSTLLHLRALLNQMAEQPELRGTAADLETRLASLNSHSVFNQTIYLLDQNGNLLGAAQGQAPSLQINPRLDWKSIPAVRQVLQGEDFSLSIWKYEQPWGLFAVPIVAGGQRIGALAVVLDLANREIFPFARPFDLGATGTLDVVDGDGLVLISTRPERLLRDSQGDELLNRLFVAGRPGVETCLGCYGQESSDSFDEMVAFAPLAETPWGVVVRQKSSEVMAPVTRLSVQFLVLGGITVLGALVLVWLTTNSVINPVQDLTMAARRMAEGDLSERVSEHDGEKPLFERWADAWPVLDLLTSSTHRTDEIGALGESFERMRVRLKSSIEEISALNRDLDARVQERTQAAIQANESLRRRNEQLSTLNRIAITVTMSLKLEEILERALEEILRLTGVDAGAVFLLEDALGGLKLMAHSGLSEEAARMAAEFGLLDGSCGGVIEHGQLVVVSDLYRYHGKRARSLQKEQLCALMHVPLSARGAVLGSLCIGTRQRCEFSSEDQELLAAIGSQIAAAIENARLYTEVQHKEHVRGELFKKAITAQEEERKRIARELHDETSQSLAALLFAIEEGLEMDSLEPVQKRLWSMKDLAQHTLDGVHKLIFDLRPSMLDHLGLTPALRWFACSRLELKGVRVSVEESSTPRRLPAEVETALFRVVQEAIMNVARHAAARNVAILFNFDDRYAKVSVEDDGVGFELEDMKLQPDSARGLGLLSMQERVELLGGELEINTTPGYGTQVHIRVPIDG